MSETGIPSVDAAVVWSVALSAIIGLLAMVVRGLRKITRPLLLMLEDWNGEAGRPGVPPRPPLMQRVGDLEAGVKDLGGRLGGLERGVGRLLLDGDAPDQGGLLGGRSAV